MGWRDRDYAKFRKDEFEAIYGSTRPASSYTSRTGRGTTHRGISFRALRLIAVAVLGTAALLGVAIATGKVNDLNSLGNQLQGPSPAAVASHVQPPVRVVAPVSRRTTRITGTRLIQYGTTLTLSDSHTPMVGNIVISGRWGSGRWETFAVARGERSTYSFRIPLSRRGVLSLRIAYPDGARAVGRYQVR
jgi:hypothetical protein